MAGWVVNSRVVRESWPVVGGVASQRRASEGGEGARGRPGKGVVVERSRFGGEISLLVEEGDSRRAGLDE